MRKPIPEYYKLMENIKTKYVSKAELEKFAEKEDSGGITPLKFPKARVYYRRVAIDNVIITSLSWITRILAMLPIYYFLYYGRLGEYASAVIYTKLCIDFMLAVWISNLCYKKFIGDKFFVLIDNDEDMFENLKHKSLRELQKIFSLYPECKVMYEKHFFAAGVTNKEEENNE